ncbi:hypothetical protein CLHOM_34620 [Clostridium homopropionicum DSM 5847]|uniref:Lipoprotein n=1 Tax=Clostridium homopropionicum DSM 5847 TaxID=1121318 RepID=A0A0L6Z6H5_9CLOT|nr:hypothetical protein [Clostridium homopropionicum]KOA18560.1 hypothetical protein CLHOM_34620 [Clostridium homopropionicum DSM 5847]SFF64795.1 hypothetical protein SAMN04488501_10117 [Clostridium homopropionicum]
MKRKVTFVMFCICLCLLFFTGCSNSLKNENANLSKEIDSLKAKNQDLEKKVSELTEKVKKYEEKNITEDIYPIYTANIDTYKREIHSYVNINKDEIMMNKITALSKALSENFFNNLPIEVLNIEQKNGKSIAVINLNESKENQGVNDYSKLKGYTWATKYFQGSTGGTITSKTLIETILEREYTGEWIDGVKFLYNNKDIDFEHVPDLANINYR